MILLLDNYDSFVHNLARYFECLNEPTTVVRSDAMSSAGVLEMMPRAVVISPGPCSPYEAGNSMEIIQRCLGLVPILGICLGHQAIAAALGAHVVRTDHPIHGRSSDITHDGLLEFESLPNPFRAGRYHSLTVEENGLPPTLRVSARSEDGKIMALRHAELPVVGWQFHPESILTDHGLEMLAGFLRITVADRTSTPTSDAGTLQDARIADESLLGGTTD